MANAPLLSFQRPSNNLPTFNSIRVLPVKRVRLTGASSGLLPKPQLHVLAEENVNLPFTKEALQGQGKGVISKDYRTAGRFEGV